MGDAAGSIAYKMPTRTLMLTFLLGVLAVTITYAAPSQLLRTNTDSFKGTPGQLLYKDAIQVVDKIQNFLTTISEFEKMQLEEEGRELEIQKYGVQRNKKNGGFKTQAWKRKRRSTMEEEILSAAYLDSLDNKASELLTSIQAFTGDLQKVRQIYEGPRSGRELRSSTKEDIQQLDETGAQFRK